VAAVGGAVLGVLGGVLGRDGWLGRQIARRQARVLRELPTLTDLLCLAVTAGEGPRAALERTVARSQGALSRELAVVLGDLRAGEPFTTAMERLAVRVPVPAVVRFVDGLVVAVERGTPLGDVLRAQAADVREQHKRDLIEAGGRREVLMLVPVVFLELPVLILFALYQACSRCPSSPADRRELPHALVRLAHPPEARPPWGGTGRRARLGPDHGHDGRVGDAGLGGGQRSPAGHHHRVPRPGPL
jgi:hypothetical protein